MILKFQQWVGNIQTVQAQIRLLPKEQSDLGLAFNNLSPKLYTRKAKLLKAREAFAIPEHVPYS